MFSELTRRHRHKPVRRIKLVASSRTALLDVLNHYISVKHSRPTADCSVNHWRRLRGAGWLYRCTGRLETNGILNPLHLRKTMPARHEEYEHEQIFPHGPSLSFVMTCD